MKNNQNHSNNNQTQDNTTIGTLNHNVVLDNGTNSQDNPINNSNINKHTSSQREIDELIAFNTEARTKGYGFKERLKKRWDDEFTDKTCYSAKGVQNIASRFKKERKRSTDSQNPLPIIEEPIMKQNITCNGRN